MRKLKPFDKITLARNCLNLSSMQKLILVIIATHLGKNDFCFLSLDTLQQECSIGGRRHLVKYLKQLNQIGLLYIIEPSNGFKSNRYGINFEMIINKAVPPWELVQFPLSKEQFPFAGVQFPRGNSKRTHKDLKENKEKPFVDKNEKSLLTKQSWDNIRKVCGIKKENKD